MKRAWKGLKKNITVFLLFEILFRIFLIFLFTDGVGKIIDILLHFQGYSYVTQGNYVSFLSHPSAIAGIIFAVCLILCLILYEICGLFLLFDAGRNDVKLSLASVLYLAWKYAAAFIKKYPLRWLLYLLLCVPNLYLHLIIWEVDRARFIDIIAGDITEKIGIPCFVILLVIYLLLAIVFSLALPFKIFKSDVLSHTWPIAFSVRKGKHLNNLFASFYLHIRVFVITGFFYMLAVVSCVFAIRTFRPVNRYVSDSLFYGSILKLILGIIIGFLGTVTIIGYLYTVFRETEKSCICWGETPSVHRPKLVIFLALFITGAILTFKGVTFIPDTSEAQDYLEISAHRGGARFAPENTLAALQYSIDTKADYAEIDVQETEDGEIILLHDNWLARTTGFRQYIWNVTYSQLQELDAGSYFSKKFAGEKIPTLREAIEVCRGKLRLNIEIKANGHNQDIVQKVLDIIHEENFVDNCIVTSMDYKFLKEIKELSPEVVTGYTLSMVYGRVEDMDAADIYSVKHSFVNRRLVERVHEMGKQICAWTTNSRASIRKVIDAGVDNVITDNPELVRKELMGEYDYIPEFISLIKYMIQ